MPQDLALVHRIHLNCVWIQFGVNLRKFANSIDNQSVSCYSKKVFGFSLDFAARKCLRFVAVIAVQA